MTDQLELMTKYLVNLQFYSESEDLLYSRDKKHSLWIPGIDSVISAFENVFRTNLDLIRKKQFRAFLDAVAQKIQYDVQSVLQDFNENVEEIGSDQLNDELSANFLIGPIRAAIQRQEFDACIYEIKKKAILQLDERNAKQVVENRISDFFQRNDSTVSMLHNLALLKYLTETFGNGNVIKNVNLVYDQYCEELIRKLSRRSDS